MRKYIRQTALGIAIALLATFSILFFININDLLAQLAQFQLWLLLPIVGLKLINWILRYLEWHYFLHIINVHPVLRGETRPPSSEHQPATIRVQDSFILWMASLPFALSPGKIAEVLKALILKNMTQTPMARSTPIIFAERLIDGIAVVIIVGAVAALMPNAIFSAEVLDTNDIRTVIIAITAFMIGLITAAQFKPIAYFLIDAIGRVPLLSRFQAEIRTLYDSSNELTKLRHLLNTTLFGLGAYFSDCIGFYLILLGLGESPSATLFAQATFILGFSVIISAISAMPGGAGGREVTIAVMLSSIVGMSKDAVGAGVLLIGIFQIWLGVVVGILIGLAFYRRLFPPTLFQNIGQTAKLVARDHSFSASQHIQSEQV